MKIIKVLKAHDLPECWDRFVEDYFQTKEFLNYTEKYNPCKQRYYTLYHDGIFKAGSVVYTLRLDLFTYLSIPSPFRMNIVGIPCSVSCCGIVGSFDLFSYLIEHIKSQEKGLLLVLNLDSKPSVSKVVVGRTLPTISMANRFQSWESYIQSLKANYRRRIIRLSRPFSQIDVKRGLCSQFNDEMYHQYNEVLKRSKGKLETLSLQFFQNLPSNFKLTAYYDQENLLGWYISTVFKEKYYFFLGGIDYEMNKRFNTYFNMLFGVLREGIEKRASFIDLGQTAEIPKIRLGGEVDEKFMLGYHSNWLVRKLLKAGKSILEYSTTVPETHVFKETI
jgi:hypothetical protein